MDARLGLSLRQERDRALSEPWKGISLGEPQAPGQVTLSLLRGFRLEHDGIHIELPLGTQRLIAFLAVHGRPLERLFVAGSLWIDTNEEHANANLRTALWRLRRLEVPLIAATRSQLALVPGVAVDVHELAARARRMLSRESSSPRPLDAFLFDGDLLADWYDDWVLVERERFRQLRLHALEQLCDDLTEARSYASAVDAGLACIAAEPLRESAHRALIKAHLAEGNPGEAIRQYKLYRKLVLDQLGIEPSEAMRRVVESLPIR